MAILSMTEIAAYAKAAGFSGNSLITAVAVAMAESSGSTTVVNRLGCTGLWQIYVKVHKKAHPTWTTSWLKQPGNNAHAAYVLSNRGKNWRPWEAYTNGAYRKYLSAARRAVKSAPSITAVKYGPRPGKGRTVGRALSIASSQVGYVERRDNHTKYWDEFNRLGWTDIKNGYWCAAFVTWVLYKTGFTKGQIKSMYGSNPWGVFAMMNYAKKKKRWTTTPKPGYITVYSYSHVDIVEKVLRNGKFQTIGGNTSSSNRGSQNNGGMVARKVKTRKGVLGFIKIDYDAGGSLDPTSPDWVPGTDTPDSEMTSGGKLTVNGDFNGSTAELLARYFGFQHGGLPTAKYWKEIEKIARFPVKWQDGQLDKETVMFLQYATYQKANGVWNATCIRNIQEHLNGFVDGKNEPYAKWGK